MSWEPQLDDEGNTFYVHSDTGKVSWDNPEHSYFPPEGAAESWATDDVAAEGSWPSDNVAQEEQWGSEQPENEAWSSAKSELGKVVAGVDAPEKSWPSETDGLEKTSWESDEHFGDPAESWPSEDHGAGEEAWAAEYGEEAWPSEGVAPAKSWASSEWHSGHDDAASEQEASPVALEEYWEEMIDESGHAYFVNEATGAMRWDVPGGGSLSEPSGTGAGGDPVQTDTTMTQEPESAIVPGTAGPLEDIEAALEDGALADGEAATEGVPTDESALPLSSEALAAVSAEALHRHEDYPGIFASVAEKMARKVIEKATKNCSRTLERMWYIDEKRTRAAENGGHHGKTGKDGIKKREKLTEGSAEHTAMVERCAQADRDRETMMKELEKPVERIDAAGNSLKKYASGLDCCEEMGCEPKDLWQHLGGKAVSCQGKLFRFRKDDTRPMTAAELADLADLSEGQFDKPLLAPVVQGERMAATLQALVKARRGLCAPPRRIILNFESIGDEGLKELSENLHAVTLAQLFLVKTSISDLGLGHLAAVLHTNKSLTELYLNDNSITDEGVRLLCKSLEDSSLHTLNLNVNPISDRGAQYLAEWAIRPRCQVNIIFTDTYLNLESTRCAIFTYLC